MKKKLTFLYILAITICSTSCKKFIEVKQPSNRITGDVVFQDNATALAAINGCYARLSNISLTFANGGSSVFLGMYADELTTNITSVDYTDFANSNVSSNNSIVLSNFWRNGYETIYQVNRCLQGLQNSTSIPKPSQDQWQGECYFLRAFCYFYLVNLFGDIPLTTVTNYENNSLLPRSASAEVYKQMKDDLIKATALLKPEYPSEGKFRANRYAALALLSRLCLYAGDWQDADRYSSEVIASGLYPLPSLANAFLKSSSEAIWQTTIDGQTVNTYDGASFVPRATASVLPSYPMTDMLRLAFETGDQRYSNWIGSKTVNGVTFYYPNKYKSRGTVVTEKVEQPIMLRSGEQYLIRAEARAKLNNLSGAESDLRLVRARAGLTTGSISSESLLLAAIIRERRIELFAEFGHRWFDLKRNGQLNSIMSYKAGWQETDALFPIPQSEINVDPNLTQNPGY